MPSIENSFAIVDINGPFREPREQVFSYDYSIQRSTWATPHGVRVKVSIPDELEVFKRRLLGMVIGSPGQQLMMSNILSKTIADRKMRVAEGEGMLAERRDMMLRAVYRAIGPSVSEVRGVVYRGSIGHPGRSATTCRHLTSR